MSIVEIDGVKYEVTLTPGFAPSIRLLFKSSHEPECPNVPGTVYIVYREDEVMGWVGAMTASQAVETSFGHPHNPKYRAIAWSLCKHETQRLALEEGRIEGRIWEGCPDCQSLIDTLNAQIISLRGELAIHQSSATATSLPPLRTLPENHDAR